MQQPHRATNHFAPTKSFFALQVEVPPVSTAPANNQPGLRKLRLVLQKVFQSYESKGALTTPWVGF